MEIIRKYFSDLEPEKLEKLEQLKPLYEEWNNKINVISRKDMVNFYTHHVLHSLSIAKIIHFVPGTHIMDVGTGGGFPGIPLAILFPECHFTLVDSIEKKIKVVSEVKGVLELNNVTPLRERAENVPGKFDFIVSRAVTALPAFMGWVQNKIKSAGINSLPNGVLYLKGGEFQDELKCIPYNYKIYHIPDYFSEEFFETKKVVHIFPGK
ncbi:MAG: 16S rRNA (guanine(527)-N(7))-methyltransferase RsmG [Bacteroidales bacterium]|nr:16S rRNA (guanine(527)-N(7))-methyltransferase RsmG [Bacteroidales bacterium]